MGGITPTFDPATGASGGPSVPAPAADTGAPKLVLDTDMTASPTVDMSSVGTFTVDGVAWTTTAAVATVAEANASGTIFTSDSATVSYIVCQIPTVSKDDFVCVAVEWELLTMAATNSTFLIKLGSAAGDTDSEYDLFMQLRKSSGSVFRVRNAYRGSSSWTVAYNGTNPFTTSITDTRLVMMLYGSGYSWTTSVSTAAGRPAYRGLVPENAAGGSLRSRSNGQTNLDANPPNLQYLKIGWNPVSNDMSARVVGVQVWVGARVV